MEKGKTISVERDCFNFDGNKNFVKKINNLKAGQIKEFTLEDLEFNGTLSLDPIKISDVEKELLESNFVPLDIYCAQSLYKKLKDDLGFAWDLFNKAMLSNIYFVGSVLEKKDSNCQEKSNKFFLYITYPDNKFNNPVLSVCKDKEFDISKSCLAVFKKSFIEKEEVRIKEIAKEKKKHPWPTISECQATAIRLLKEENEKLKAKCGELEKINQELQKKYNKNVCKIIEPELSAEVIKLLCKRICDFDLGIRVIRAMEKTEIIYLFQLISWKQNDLEKIRNIRSVSINKIKVFLTENELELGTNFSQEEYNYFWKKVEEK